MPNGFVSAEESAASSWALEYTALGSGRLLKGVYGISQKHASSTHTDLLRPYYGAGKYSTDRGGPAAVPLMIPWWLDACQSQTVRIHAYVGWYVNRVQ